MKAVSKALLGTVFALGLAATVPAFAQQSEAGPGANAFVTMLDMNKNGMVTKAEAMEMFGKMFDKADTGKKGELTKQQAMDLYKMLTTDSKGS